jgi:flagellar protein FlaI
MEEKVEEEYNIGPALVRIVSRGSRGYYVVEEPPLTPAEIRVEAEAMDRVYYSDQDFNDLETALADYISKTTLSAQSVEKILYDVRKRTSYGKITVPMQDPEVEEIEFRGVGHPITVIHSRFTKYKRLITNITLTEEREVISLIESLASRSGKSISLAKPYLEFSLPEGHRVAATLSSEISLPGSTFDVRKFPIKPLTPTHLFIESTINVVIASYLWFLMDYKPFIMVLGPTGSGKTTFVNSLLYLTDPQAKVITIEDTPELNIPNPNWVRLISRSSIDGIYDVKLMDLARLALRYRPDYLVIGEVRGREIEALIHSSASGHSSISTFHAARPQDVLTRVRGLLERDLAILFMKNISIMITMGDFRDSYGFVKRRITRIYENSGDGKKFEVVIKWNEERKTFEPQSLEELIATSRLIRRISKHFEISEESTLKDLERRRSILEGLYVNKITDQEKIFEYIAKFYEMRGHEIETFARHTIPL